MVTLAVNRESKIAELCGNDKLAVVTMSQTRDKNLSSTIDVLKSRLKIRRVLTPEHGYYGELQSGEYSDTFFDGNLGFEMTSLYRNPGHLSLDKDSDLDEIMRKNDTIEGGKFPEKEHLEDVDTVIFDIQDVGTRIYTFSSTMYYTMKVAADLGEKFVVLDRPNPITGLNPEGPVLDYPNYSSYIGVSPVPIRHALTLGELARYLNDKLLNERANLGIVTMQGWKRNMWYDDTGLSWLEPSPNMPTLSTAIVYPGAVMLEGTNVSEGRGTTNPFLTIGSPWIDGYGLSKAINDMKIPGVGTIPRKFRPTFSKFQGLVCSGIEVVVTDRNIFKPFYFYLQTIQYLYENYEEFDFHSDYFDRVCGNSKTRKLVTSGASNAEIFAEFEQEVNEFQADIKNYTLY